MLAAADDRWAAAREAGERTSQRTDLLARSLLAARACSLAFVPPSAIRYEPYAKGLRCVAQIEDPATLSGATVLETAAGEVVLACRGSASFKNFGTTTDIGPEPLLANPMARVHRGFQRASEGMWPLLRPHLPATGGRLLVTGHSLGGGTATLLALKCEAAGLTPELITVAGPRLGDAAFASHYRERCGEAVHLVHERDEVLTSNTKLWDDLGFAHVGRVVRAEQKVERLYDDGSGEACLAAEGGGGPPSLQGILVDHCEYLGLYIGVRAEHPSVWLRPPW